MNNAFSESNLILQRKLNLDNEYLSKKINFIQPTIDQKCPESYLFSKTYMKNLKYKSFSSKYFLKLKIS